MAIWLGMVASSQIGLQVQYGDNLTVNSLPVDSSDGDGSAGSDNGIVVRNSNQGMNDLEAPLMDKGQRNRMDRHPEPVDRPSQGNGGIITGALMKNIIIDAEKNCIVELMKILINYLQVTAILVSLNVDWAHYIKRTFEIAECFSGFTVLVTSFVSDCLGHDVVSVARPLVRLLVGLATPLVVGVAIIAIWSLCNFLRKRSFESISDFVLLTFYVVFYISYLGITKLVVGQFHCVSVYDSMDFKSTHKAEFLADDTSVHCFEGVHWVLIAIAIVALIIFCVGLPILSFRIRSMTRIGHFSRRSTPISTLGFTDFPYRSNYCYWEALVFARKASIAAICVLGHSIGGNTGQVLAGLILMIFLFLQMSCSPYLADISILNGYESTSLFLSTATAALGLASDSDSNEGVRIGGAVVLAILNLVFIGFFALPIWWSVKRIRSFV